MGRLSSSGACCIAQTPIQGTGSLGMMPANIAVNYIMLMNIRDLIATEYPISSIIANHISRKIGLVREGIKPYVIDEPRILDS
jgi:hypothetical protein